VRFKIESRAAAAGPPLQHVTNSNIPPYYLSPDLYSNTGLESLIDVPQSETKFKQPHMISIHSSITIIIYLTDCQAISIPFRPEKNGPDVQAKGTLELIWQSADRS
jgi:hypothetical protein